MSDERDPTLAAAIAALRDVGAEPSPEVASTRMRVMASLERRQHGARKRIAIIAVLATLGTGTLSWAAATGRIDRALVAMGLREAPPVEPAPVALPEAPTPPRAAVETPRSIPLPDPATDDPPAEAPEPAIAPAPAPPKRTVRRVRPPVEDSVERALYRRAHDAHFRAADPAAALAAWDAYLAERPTGRFAVEARYNRALALVRLRRLDEARAALLPFAERAVGPGGYREREARELVDAIDRAEAP